MPKRQINITKNVMSKIKKEEIKMKPRWYFVVGSVSAFLAVVGLIIFSVFLISLVTFSLRSHGPMGEVRMQEILSNFPWWALVLAIVGMAGGITMLRKYDFSYKKNFMYIILAVIVAVLVSGVLINFLGFDNLWIRRGPMRKFYQRYENRNNMLQDDLLRNNGRMRRNLR